MLSSSAFALPCVYDHRSLISRASLWFQGKILHRFVRVRVCLFAQFGNHMPTITQIRTKTSNYFYCISGGYARPVGWSRRATNAIKLSRQIFVLTQRKNTRRRIYHKNLHQCHRVCRFSCTVFTPYCHRNNLKSSFELIWLSIVFSSTQRLVFCERLTPECVITVCPWTDTRQAMKITSEKLSKFSKCITTQSR